MHIHIILCLISHCTVVVHWFRKRVNVPTRHLTDSALEEVYTILYQGPSWLWSHSSWIYNYQCNQCLPTNVVSSNPAQARCTRYNIMWSSLSVTCSRSVVFSGYSYFPHQYNWPPWYNWNIVESGVQHHKPNQQEV
jgi:hypothetical protein